MHDDGDDGFGLEDDIDDGQALAAEPAAGKRVLRPASLKVEPLMATADLTVTDLQGFEDPAAWFQLCPVGSDQASVGTCCIQRWGTRHIMAWDVNGTLRVRVQRLRCSVHGKTWLLTRPDMWRRLQRMCQAGQLRITPRLMVITTKCILTGDAYKCGSP